MGWYYRRKEATEELSYIVLAKLKIFYSRNIENNAIHNKYICSNGQEMELLDLTSQQTLSQNWNRMLKRAKPWPIQMNFFKCFNTVIFVNPLCIDLSHLKNQLEMEYTVNILEHNLVDKESFFTINKNDKNIFIYVGEETKYSRSPLDPCEPNFKYIPNPNTWFISLATEKQEENGDVEWMYSPEFNIVKTVEKQDTACAAMYPAEIIQRN